MGLGIKSKNKDYHCSYYGIHLIRWLALIDCGFPELINDIDSCLYYPNCFTWTTTKPAPTPQKLSDMLFACQKAGYIYPNILLHSDCEGNYTKNGKPLENNDLLTGNSIDLLKELKMLKKNMKGKCNNHKAWGIFKMFYEVVEDSVKNKSSIEFH